MATMWRKLAVERLLCVAMAAAAACTPQRQPTMTVSDLMADRLTLDSVLLKCSREPARAAEDPTCLNARVAVERLAQDVDPAEIARRNAEFERRRERLRLAQEQARMAREARDAVDPYQMPVVPLGPSGPSAASADPASTPVNPVEPPKLPPTAANP